MIIRVLSDQVVDRIAAGEVVERPASVVKELVENALDAGARRVEIRLKEGGTELVRVTDDGSGMSRDDALLCLERHATSKIRDVPDLFGVRTMGFRGEALPSIASVSRFELRTRRVEDEVGTEVRVEGGRIEHVGAIACPVGTDIAVRGLFFNVPARRKFLRARQTELEHAEHAVIRALLRRPDVAVLLQHDGRDRLRAEATPDAIRRAIDLLGEDLAGLVATEARVEGVTARAWVAPLGVDRADASSATWAFVRGRYVRDPVVRKAITEAFDGALPRGRSPVVIVDVDLADGDVDVNVHPAKIEVRFSSPREVGRAVADAVRAGVRGPGAVPSVRPPPREGQLELIGGAGRLPALPPEPALQRAPARPAPAGPSATPPALRPAPVTPAPRARPPALPPAPAVRPPQRPPEPSPVIASGAPPWRSPQAESGLRTLHPLSLVHDVLVAEGGGEIVIVDVVAIQVEVEEARLRAAHAEGRASGRPLLTPEVVDVAPARRARLLDRVGEIEPWGLRLLDFGPGQIAIAELPVDVVDAGALLAALDGAGEIPRLLARAAARPPATLHEARSWLAAWDELGRDATKEGLARRLSAAALRALLAAR